MEIKLEKTQNPKAKPADENALEFGKLLDRKSVV